MQRLNLSLVSKQATPYALPNVRVRGAVGMRSWPQKRPRAMPSRVS